MRILLRADEKQVLDVAGGAGDRRLDVADRRRSRARAPRATHLSTAACALLRLAHDAALADFALPTSNCGLTSATIGLPPGAGGARRAAARA